ncbi:MAG: DegV family protein [Clostridia bacterium]|nr:DegV family protein [Clostridia bacterium]
MADYVLATCSTADISPEHMKQRNIEYVKYSFYLDGKECQDDLGQTISFDDFYQMMRDGVDTKTSQPNAQHFKDFFIPFLNDGKDVILLNLSSGLSGAQTSAKIAAEELKDEYPDRKVYVVDSLGASSGMGLLVDKMADLRDEGMNIDDLYVWTEANKLKLHHWFFSTDLTFYVKGGRVSKVAGWFGTVLKICPLLNMDMMGHLIPREKIRGKANVIKAMVKKMEENAIDGLNYSGKCYISHADSYEDARQVADLIEERFPKLNGKVLINSIGTTIGSHTGPGTVAVFFFGKERND